LRPWDIQLVLPCELITDILAEAKVAICIALAQ